MEFKKCGIAAVAVVVGVVALPKPAATSGTQQGGMPTPLKMRGMRSKKEDDEWESKKHTDPVPKTQNLPTPSDENA